MEKTIKVAGENLIIKKIPIGKYGELIKKIKSLPKHLQNIETLNAETLIASLPDIIGDGLPDFIAIVSYAINKPEEDVKEYGLDDFAKIIEAIFEVNNYDEVYKIIKKALAHPMLKRQETQNPPTSNS